MTNDWTLRAAIKSEKPMNLSGRVLNLLAVVSTVVMLAVVAYRFAGVASFNTPKLVSSEREWRTYAAKGMIVGNDAAPVTITVFSDFQCPFCKSLADSIEAVMGRSNGRVRMVFRNRPIQAIHPHSMMAARASVCAYDQQRFAQFHNVLLARQDELGVASWEQLAAEAGVLDTTRFQACRLGSHPDAIIAADTLDAARLRITGTPLLLVNDVMVRALPPGRMLDSLVQDALLRSSGER